MFAVGEDIGFYRGQRDARPSAIAIDISIWQFLVCFFVRSKNNKKLEKQTQTINKQTKTKNLRKTNNHNLKTQKTMGQTTNESY